MSAAHAFVLTHSTLLSCPAVTVDTIGATHIEALSGLTQDHQVRILRAAEALEAGDRFSPSLAFVVSLFNAVIQLMRRAELAVDPDEYCYEHDCPRTHCGESH